ncbi:MAG TPA: type IX secretion system outer membrane channel protein PorV [Puia sp.]|nr:type IX secretion system outer membrane channel protein PorV [Puia sp.]
MKRSLAGLTALLMLLLSVVCISKVRAQTVPAQVNVVTTAVPFLRISPDARAGGMGDLGIATSPDASSSYYNLSKTPFAKKDIGISFTYTPWLKDLGLNDVYLLAASGYKKLNDNEALSASVRYFSLGSIDFTDYSGNSIGNGRPREFGADIGYSRKLGDKLSVGLAARYIYSNLAAGYAPTGTTYQPGKTFAADVSFFYHGATDEAGGWNFGAAISNLGGKIGYTNDATEKDYIPTDLGLGATYTFVPNEDNKITFGLDLHKLLVPAPPIGVDNGGPIDSANLAAYHGSALTSSWFKSFSGPNQLKLIQASIGAEYGYQDQFFFRAGYYYENKDEGNRKYFSVGVGLKYNVMNLNFSYLVPSGNGTTRNPLSNTLRFGLSFDLDSGGGDATPATTPTN